MPLLRISKTFGYLITNSLLGLTLLPASPARANLCDECFVTTNPVPADWEEREKASTHKPDNLSPEEIAKVLALSSRMQPSRDGVVDSRISKWETPLRVRIVGVDGSDLPLDQSPGNVIAGFLQRLSRDTDIPISITTLAKKDNNVSIVAGVLPSNTSKEVLNSNNRKITADSQTPFLVADDFANIQGVAGMNDTSRKLAGAWLARSDDQGKWFNRISFGSGFGHARHNFTGVYRVGAEIKACALILNHSKASVKNMASIVKRLNEEMPTCLGVDSTRVGLLYTDLDTRLKMTSAYAIYSRYFLKLLYHNTKAGTAVHDAEKAALEYIKR